MDKIRQRIADWWSRWQALSYLQKLMWSVGVGGSLGVTALLWWASQPDFRVLYVGLSAEEAGGITAKLQAKSVPFKLAAGGSAILVPSDQMDQIRVDLNKDGGFGPNAGKGFDLFDQPSLHSTPFNQHVNYLRAQQTELAKTIMQMEPIAQARVHIVRPEPSPFVREQKPTTASVMVKVRGGAMLNRSTVTAISSLVAGSIEGLAKENVRIVDQNGRLLSEERDPDSGMFGSASDARREVEEYRSRRAEAMLESVLGSGKAIVRVTAELDMKIVKKKQEIINAEARTPKMEKSVSTKSNTTSNQAANKGGPAGSSGPAKGNTTTTGSSGVNSSSETTQTEYVVPSTFIEELKKPGAIERLTVAVFIDSDAFKKSDPPISLESLKDAIKNAVGFKSDRDEIQVTLVRMPSTAPETNEEEAAATARMQTILTIVRNVSIGAIALCVMPIVWMLFRRRKHVAVPAPATSPQIQRITEELDRNPDALAKILTLWIDRADASERKAA